jgi:hypothetical protein
MQNDLPAGRQDNPPVHEKTKIGSDFRYGCNNHAPRQGAVYWAPNRVYADDGTFTVALKDIETEWIEYDVCPAKHDHQGCLGCVHGGDHGV